MNSIKNEGVILLHGLCRTSASMGRMQAALTAAGYRVENVDYPSRTANIKELAETAIGSALLSTRLKACERIHFVTHSLGSILVRSYFSVRHEPKLGRVVMLGPPNQGSGVVDKLGRLSLFKKMHGPAGDELGTDSNSTPNMLGAVNFELGIIAGDRSINLINSLMLDGPDDGKVSVEHTKVSGMKEHLVVHVAHPFLMTNSSVIKKVALFLETGSFCPRDEVS
jgi:triacylglycerol lipase